MFELRFADTMHAAHLCRIVAGLRRAMSIRLLSANTT